MSNDLVPKNLQNKIEFTFATDAVMCDEHTNVPCSRDADPQSQAVAVKGLESSSPLSKISGRVQLEGCTTDLGAWRWKEKRDRS